MLMRGLSFILVFQLIFGPLISTSEALTQDPNGTVDDSGSTTDSEASLPQLRAFVEQQRALQNEAHVLPTGLLEQADDDPYFFRAQNWSNSPEYPEQTIDTETLSFVSTREAPPTTERSRGISLQIGPHQYFNLRGYPFSYIGGDESYLFLSLRDSRAHGIFVIDQQELALSSHQGSPVGIYFVPLPGEGWNNSSSLALPIDALFIYCFRNQKGEIVPLQQQQLAEIIELSKLNIRILAHDQQITRLRQINTTQIIQDIAALSMTPQDRQQHLQDIFSRVFHQLDLRELPQHSTLAFGLIINASVHETETASLSGNSTSWYAPWSLLISDAVADPSAQLMNGSIGLANQAWTLLTSAKESHRFLMSLGLGLVVAFMVHARNNATAGLNHRNTQTPCDEALLPVASTSSETSSDAMVSHREEQRSSVRQYFDTLTYFFAFMGQISSVFFGHTVQAITDRLGFTHERSLLRRGLNATILFTSGGARRQRVNAYTWLKTFVGFAPISIGFTFIHIYWTIPHILEHLSHNDLLYGHIKQAWVHSYENAQNNRAEIFRLIFFWLNSSGSQISQSLRAQFNQILRRDARARLIEEGKDPSDRTSILEAEEAVETGMNQVYQAFGLPKESPTIDSDTVFQDLSRLTTGAGISKARTGLGKALGLTTPSSSNNSAEPTYWGVLRPNLFYTALRHARTTLEVLKNHEAEAPWGQNQNNNKILPLALDMIRFMERERSILFRLDDSANLTRLYFNWQANREKPYLTRLMLAVDAVQERLYSFMEALTLLTSEQALSESGANSNRASSQSVPVPDGIKDAFRNQDFSDDDLRQAWIFTTQIFQGCFKGTLDPNSVPLDENLYQRFGRIVLSQQQHPTRILSRTELVRERNSERAFHAEQMTRRAADLEESFLSDRPIRRPTTTTTATPASSPLPSSSETPTTSWTTSRATMIQFLEQITDLGRSYRAVTESSDNEDLLPKLSFFQRIQERAIYRRSQRDYLKIHGNIFIPEDENARARFQVIYRRNFAISVGISREFFNNQSPDASPELKEANQAIATAHHRAQDFTNSYFAQDKAAYKALQNLAPHERDEYTAIFYARNFVSELVAFTEEHYTPKPNATRAENMPKLLHPLHPGRVQTLRILMARHMNQRSRLKTPITQMARIFETMFSTNSYHLGVKAWLERAIPFFHISTDAATRAFRNGPTKIIGQNGFDFLFYGVTYTPEYILLSMFTRFALTTPEQWINRVFLTLGLQPMGPWPTMLAYATLVSSLSFGQNLLNQIFLPDAIHARDWLFHVAHARQAGLFANDIRQALGQVMGI